jgi:phosphoglucomutase
MAHIENLDDILKSARNGIEVYLQAALDNNKIDKQLYKIAMENTYSKLKEWLEYPDIEGVSSAYKNGIINAINEQKWQDLINAFRQTIRFGTGGIRGQMAFDKESIIRLKEEGIAADVLKGPNTINDLVFLQTTAGVARFGMAQNPQLSRVVIGYDSRIRGYDFAKTVAQVFLDYDYTVFFFDNPCPYPEVTFAIPFKSEENDITIKADIGVLISASHNDYRYNGYKLSCSNGSQFDPTERDEMYNEYISKVKPEHIKICKFEDAPKDKLWFLGGSKPLPDVDYYGCEDNLIDLHAAHRDHIKTFLQMENLPESQNDPENQVHIGFCPFHGAGRIAVPRLLREVGFHDDCIMSINGNKSNINLNKLDGLFPAFCSDAGHEQQPDPGDPRAAHVAVKAFKEDYPGEFENLDILIGTDPDADRCGIVVKIPENQQHVYNNQDYYLLPADDMWSLVLWYRLHMEGMKNGGLSDADKQFLVLSHTTSDAIIHIAKKNGVGVVKTWVGFAALAASTRDIWDGKYKEFETLVEGRDDRYTDLCHPFVCESYWMDSGKRSINIAAMEQSNGFSLLGGPPPDGRSLGVGGHVRDKDGTFAGLLVAEIAAWAKSNNTSIIGLLDEKIYLDPEIGLFATFYEPDPLDGEYPGIEGDRLKKEILLKAIDYHKQAQSGDFEIGGVPVKSAVIYRTGKYDAIYPPSASFQFPDEGLRFFFDEKKLQHVTVRPSGTGNSLRFHIQLHEIPTADNLIETKKNIREKGRRIMDDLRIKLGAPR